MKDKGEGKANQASPEVLFARRGTRWLTQTELDSHIASLIRLENVGFLMGAGTSMGPLGGLSMSALLTVFAAEYKTSYDWLCSNRFVQDETPPNVEALLDTIHVAKAEWTRAERKEELAALESARMDLQRALIGASLLKRAWWEKPERVSPDSVELQSHRQLLQKITSTRQPGQPAPWIFTTNYDLAIEWAAESMGLKVISGFDGFHRREFSPHNFDLGYRNVLARGEARFGTYNVYLAKLHGSLSWYVGEDGSYLEAPSKMLWPAIKEFLDGKTGVLAEPLVFPTAAKYLQTVGFVSGELLRRFAEFLARPQTSLMICGYSFGDEHLNRLLLTGLQNPTLQLLVCVPNAANSGNELDVSQCGKWLQRLLGLSSPQVTIIAGRPHAYFANLMERMPDPVIYDEQAARIRQLLRDVKSDGALGITTEGDEQ